MTGSSKKGTLLGYLAMLKKRKGFCSSCTVFSLIKLQPASLLLALVISPKYVPSEPAEECTHVMSCADITTE